MWAIIWHTSLSFSFFFLIAIVACVVLWALIFLEEIKWGNYPHAPLISLFFILRGILSFFHQSYFNISRQYHSLVKAAFYY